MKGFSRNGSMSTVSMAGEVAVGAGEVVAVERYYCAGIASEVSSSYPAKDRLAAADDEGGGAGRGQQHGDEEGEAELELGLSLGAKKATASGAAVRNGGGGQWGEYCRILTAKDFPSMVASRGSPISSSSSTASSSPSLGRVGSGGVAGTKRAADSAASDVGPRPPSQVVGWPPVRAYRMNNLMIHSKDSAEENYDRKNKNNSDDDGRRDEAASILPSGIKESGARKEHEKKGAIGCPLLVKVKMDGMAIGRKVDLRSHHRYETLALALEEMFQSPTSPANPIRTARISNLLDGSSGFVLTYEDKDGDWMLVGDVPWGMFLSSVKRLRIMRTSDATGPGARCQSSKVGEPRKTHVL